MNTKADKSQLKWPPLLNLANDKPHIDTSFQNWEKVNGPYLNSMLQPVWLQKETDKYIYTKNGKRFRLLNGHLYENNNQLSPTIDAYKFEKKSMDIFGRDILAVGLYSESEYGLVAVKRTSIGVDVLLHNQTVLGSYIINGAVIDARVFVESESNIIIVVAYVQGTNYKTLNIKLNATSRTLTSIAVGVTWKIQKGFTSDGEQTVATLDTLDNLRVTDPVITGYYQSNISRWFISLTSSYGEVEDTKKNGFFTYALQVSPGLSSTAISTFKCMNNGNTSYDIVQTKSMFFKTGKPGRSIV